MKKLLLIYNTNSGSKNFASSLDNCVDIFQNSGFFVTLFRISKKSDIFRFFISIEQKYFDTIVISGGDGTINTVINACLKCNIISKFGILPTGTANDFATYLKIDKNIQNACNLIIKNKTKYCDIGLINNEKYFTNVVAAGLFANIYENIDPTLKTFFGTFAYYLKGIEHLSNFEPISIQITTSNNVIKENVYFFMILNSSCVAGFDNIITSANIVDGVFDFVAIKASPLSEIAVLPLKILQGDHLKDPNVIYIQDSYFKIELFENISRKLDIDGEQGPDFPVEIKNLHKAVQIYTN